MKHCTHSENSIGGGGPEGGGGGGGGGIKFTVIKKLYLQYTVYFIITLRFLFFFSLYAYIYIIIY